MECVGRRTAHQTWHVPQFPEQKCGGNMRKRGWVCDSQRWKHLAFPIRPIMCGTMFHATISVFVRVVKQYSLHVLAIMSPNWIHKLTYDFLYYDTIWYPPFLIYAVTLNFCDPKETNIPVIGFKQPTAFKGGQCGNDEGGAQIPKCSHLIWNPRVISNNGASHLTTFSNMCLDSVKQ